MLEDEFKAGIQLALNLNMHQLKEDMPSPVNLPIGSYIGSTIGCYIGSLAQKYKLEKEE